MKVLSLALTAAALAVSTPALSGDAALGKQKAAGCVLCHGNETFGGVFYTLQLGGRNADKLTIKTNKYKSGKILHPIMNFATALLSDKDVEDISAYYQSLGKPAVVSPLFKIKGDDDVQAAAPAASLVAAR